MRGRGVCDVYLVCLDLSEDLPGNGARNPSCYVLSQPWFSRRGEGDAAKCSISISLSFENQGINPVGGSSKVPRTYTNKQRTRNQRNKGVVNPFTATYGSEI